MRIVFLDGVLVAGKVEGLVEGEFVESPLNHLHLRHHLVVANNLIINYQKLYLIELTIYTELYTNPYTNQLPTNHYKISYHLPPTTINELNQSINQQINQH